MRGVGEGSLGLGKPRFVQESAEAAITQALIDELAQAVFREFELKRECSNRKRFLSIDPVLSHEPVERCGARLIPVTGNAVDGLLRDSRYLVRTTIPANLYRGHDKPIPSYGPLAVMVSTSQVPADLVYRLVKATFDHLEELRKDSPSFAELNNWDMISAGLTAPLHEGAVRYYRERGWIR